METDMQFIFSSPIEIEETFKDGKTVISGTLLVEGRSRNKNYYTLEEMKGIAKTAMGAPIRFGTETRVDPNSGILDPNMHAKGDHNIVGQIVRTAVDKIKKRIKFWAQIMNTVTHPNIAETVKKGWGVSIGGNARGGRWILDQMGKLVLKVFGVKIDHVQLLKPTTRRGQDEAKVEDVEIQETALAFSKLPPIKINIIGDYKKVEKITFKF